MPLTPTFRENIRSMLLLFVVLTTLFLSSCVKLSVGTYLSDSPSAARLLLYLHSTSGSSDIDFTITGIDLETYDGKTVSLGVESPISVSGKSISSSQILLVDALVEAGSYREMKLKLSSASMARNGDRASLAIGEPNGAISIKKDFVLTNKESLVVSLEWDLMNSIRDGYRFQPAIIAELQAPSPRGLLLFVSNNGSNYISIIDRSLERVVGAVTTGERPMGMALNSAQDQLYVVNSGSKSVSVIETSHLRLLSTFPLSGGVGPADVVFIPDLLSLEGKLYITNRLSNDVTVVSTTTQRILKVIPVGNHPSFIAANMDRKEVYVTNESSNDMTIINTVNDTVVATVEVNRKPTGVSVGENKIYVFNEGASNISVVSPSLRKVLRTISLSDPPKRGISGFGGRTFVASSTAGSLTFLTTFDVIKRSIDSGSGPTGFAVDETRNRLYVTNYGDDDVSFIDPLGERILKKLPVGKKPYGIALVDR